jgi:hypothetical protein
MIAPTQGANMPNPIDLTNQKFGKLTTISHKHNGHIRSWLCVCDCGGQTIVSTNKLTSGHTQSCGCIRALTTKTNGFKNKIHGLGHGKGDPTYKSWLAMRERCRDEKNKNYGGRGISICDQWDDYRIFLADMGARPSGTSLDRIDVSGNYAPNNCRWATAKEQQRNKSNTNFLMLNGKLISAMNIADELGIKKSAMQYFISTTRKMVKRYGTILHPEGC